MSHANPVEIGLWESITLSVFEYTCGRCGGKYGGLALTESDHALLLLRGAVPGSMILADCHGEAFTAHYDDVREFCRPLRLDDVEIAYAANRTFGIRCDAGGSRVDAGRDPPCAHCGSVQAETSRELDPPLLLRMNVLTATHLEWALKTPEEQCAEFERELRAYLRRHHADKLSATGDTDAAGDS